MLFDTPRSHIAMTDTLTSTSLGPNAPLGTVLCVDDEPSILSALRRLFRARGLQVKVAESGPAGLALLESEAFDLVISDKSSLKSRCSCCSQKKWPPLANSLLVWRMKSTTPSASSSPIWSSSPGVGTTFRIVLPINAKRLG